MVKLLSQPYPIDDSVGKALRKSFLIGLFVGMFLQIFQPFGLNLWDTPHKTLKIFGFGAVTAIVTGFNFLVWRRLFNRQFAEVRWTVGREIIFVTANITLIGIANRYYLDFLIGPVERSSIHGWSMILITFLIGLFPVTGLVLLNYITQLKKYSQTAAELPIHRTSSADLEKNHSIRSEPIPTLTDVVHLVADNEKDTLDVVVNDLLFVESSDNYCTVVYLKNDQPVKPLLRSSLSRLEKQISQPHIVRCHRSYVVNLNRIERVTGNAQGYKLHLFDGQFQIPVARQYNETLVAELKAL
ncbi:LytTR family DNA-binding domain-containing protein [Spirosoma daeguense]